MLNNSNKKQNLWNFYRFFKDSKLYSLKLPRFRLQIYSIDHVIVSEFAVISIIYLHRLNCWRISSDHFYHVGRAQVLDWLEKHGEVFLRKNVGIGRNLQKARLYQKSHETFEGVVQVQEHRTTIEPEY